MSDQGLNIDPGMVLQPEFVPAVVTWNRLEGRPRREDFDRSLRAEVRDALWMLSRQWQVGEFLGVDGGTAIKAAVAVDTARLGQYSARGRAPGVYEDTIPLETIVEREDVPLGLAMRARIGAHWLRLLAANTTGDHRALYVDDFGPTEPTDDEGLARLHSDRRAAQVHAALTGRMVDGGLLLAAIRDGRHDTFVTDRIPAGDDQDGARSAADQLVQWFERVYSQPQTDAEDAWAPSYLEYQFGVTAPANDARGTTTLTAEQYHHGHLDWYSFDIDPTAEPPDDPGGAFEPGEAFAFSPSPIEFGGMPNVRWWELEDHQTEFGDLRASTTDVALLLLAEFGLAYANDWSVVPYDLDVGTIADVRGVVVTDVFGVRTLVRAAGRGPDDDWQRWGMYNLSVAGTHGPADTRLFLPPTVGKIDEGEPVERVVLSRDEMANMAWGIEHVIPGVLGQGIDGYEAASDLQRRLAAGQPDPEPAEDGDDDGDSGAYRLRTPVSENWIPLIPVYVPGSRRVIRLQRASMPRVVDGSNDPVRPRGAILRTGLDLDPPEPYFVHDEEVPKSGAMVSRTFQRARWFDGRVYTWLGRRKQTAAGQTSSGNEYDQVIS